MSWVLYILECSDKTLYTGITNDLPRRLAAHADGTGAKYLRGRSPFKLVHTENHPDRAAASRREAAIKRLKSAEKRALIAAAAPQRKPRKTR